jgi:hypothetical protein
MNTSPVTAKERLERITNAPKKPGRPRMVKIIDPPKKLGRPIKVEDKFFTSECISLNSLSQAIAKELSSLPGTITDQLAHAGGSHSALSKLQQKAKLNRVGRGNRPKDHLAILLRDSALIYEAETGNGAKSELRKIGGWEEEGDAPQSQVRVYTQAVMAALGIKHAQSLRHQARRAIEFL